MAEVGRPSKLDDQLFRKIRELILDGQNLTEIAKILDIPYATMLDWRYENYQGFADRLLSFKHERMLEKAETEIECLQSSDDEKVKLQANIHVSETLGKKYYSKKTETDLTSAGKPIFIPSEIAEKNDIQTQ